MPSGDELGYARGIRALCQGATSPSGSVMQYICPVELGVVITDVDVKPRGST